MRFCHPEVNDVIKNGPADKVYLFFSKAEGGVLKLDCVTGNCALPVKFWTFLL